MLTTQQWKAYVKKLSVQFGWHCNGKMQFRRAGPVVQKKWFAVNIGMDRKNKSNLYAYASENRMNEGDRI